MKNIKNLKNDVALEKAYKQPLLALLWLIAPLRNIIKAAYRWTVAWSTTKYAAVALGVVSFAESSFFPIPPDPLLLAMVFTKPKKWLHFAALTTIASVIGGMFGYFIGAVLWDSFGDFLLSSLHLRDSFSTVESLYEQYSVTIILVAAFTPIPFKVFTLAGGVFRVAFAPFVAASIAGRGARFFLVAALANFLGKKYKDKIERYVDIISLGFLAILIIAFIIYRLLK